jgi:hypothetical protein
VLLLELRPVARRVGELLDFRVDEPREEPELRDEVPLLDEVPLREELLVRDELVRRDVPLPVAVFAAFCAALAACSKSFRRELPNLVVSRRASETNLPRPLYSVFVLAAASRPV